VAGLRQEMQAMRLLEHKTETAETPRRWWQWGKR
ncbi:entry exclusion protein 1, partial [Bradyrhizobium japonicum]